MVGWWDGAESNFQCRVVLLLWITVGQGPSTLAIGADGSCLDISYSRYRFSVLSPDPI